MSQQCSGILTYTSQGPKNPNTEFFKAAVKDSGIKLVSTDQPNIITQEQALVVRDMEKKLETEEQITKFLRGFKILINKEKYMQKALLPCLFKKSDDLEIQQESLFRLFLKVTNLQKEMIDILTEELTNIITNESEVGQMRLILNQLQYLPHITDSKNLSRKLLDAIEVASFAYQLEILYAIPEILPDCEYNETANELSKMLEKSEDLAGAVIDCLNALSLDSDIRAQIQDYILAKILTGTSTKIFPIFLDFLLSDYNSQNLLNILTKVRNSLNVIIGSQSKNKDQESGKILIFTKLQNFAIIKSVAENWLATISNIKTHTDHKPIDLIILFMLHSTNKLRKRTIELTFRKKVKDGRFKIPLLEQLFKSFPKQLMHDYFNTIIQIFSSLLRTSEDWKIVDFATTLIKLLFQSSETTYRQEILENLVLLIGASDQKNITPILNTILELREEIKKAPNHTLVLMRLLEKLITFGLEDVRTLFEILCHLTKNECLSGKEELHIIIRKHLSSAKRDLKQKGIISAIVMAKHIASIDDDTNDSDTNDSLNLTGVAKEASQLLELTNTSISSNPELLALYYDQLALVLNKSDNLDKNFLFYLYENVTSDFQTTYVTEKVCDAIDELEFGIQFDLNEETECNLAINIAEFALKFKNISILAPHFRLLRLLHFKQQNGDLSSIDALLGCGVILPKLEIRQSLDSHQLEKFCDCLFHCVNWFRETVSGFITQKTMRKKILQRISDLNDLEEILTDCLDKTIHKLPHSYSFSDKSPRKESFKVPKKKLKTNSGESSKIIKKTTDKQDVIFREIDIDIVKLLKLPLQVCDNEGDTDQLKLTVVQLNYLLRDFVKKLEKITKNKELSPFNLMDPLQFMQDCSTIFKNVNRHFCDVIEKINKNEDEEDYVIAFGLILQSLSILFAWPAFHHSKNFNHLREILQHFKSDSCSQANSVKFLIQELFEKLSNFVNLCANTNDSVNLIKTLQSLNDISPGYTSKIAKTAGTILNKGYRTSSADIDILTKAYLASANIKTIGGMVATLQEQVTLLKHKTDTLEMLKSVTKNNLYVLYKNIWISLTDRLKNDLQSLTNDQHLTLWRNVALTMQGLMTIVKIQESKSNLVCFLKYSIGILKIFISHGIPILEIELKTETDRVVEILKTIQGNTRFLHHLCCHSKSTKDSSLMTFVPQFRLTQDTLNYKVKAALVANRCSEAFWMGTLKNRDLQGEDILSQSTENSELEEEEDENEIMPSDDENLDESGEVTSGSEVFQ